VGTTATGAEASEETALRTNADIIVMTKIDLPAVELPVRKNLLGHIRLQLQRGREYTVKQKTTVKVSARKTLPAMILDDDSVIVISDKRIQRPSYVDGVLLKKGKSDLEWSSHKLIDDFVSKQNQRYWQRVRQEILDSWEGNFLYKAESGSGKSFSPGLRGPQLAAVHEIGAHWALDSEAATVVMPTGTGKTETMLSTLVAYVRGRLLVIVPTNALRKQMADKFVSLGRLFAGNLQEGVKTPIVGVIEHRIKDIKELAAFKDCHVVIATIHTLGQGQAAPLAKQIAQEFTDLFIDEAHHIGADTWQDFRQAFSQHRILQFTATPFRADTKVIEGKPIFSFPLRRAQQDGYFKKINYKPVFEPDSTKADNAIAEAALNQLRDDLQNNLDHIIMARCSTHLRADSVADLYEALGAEFKPVKVYSGINPKLAMDALSSRDSRVLVCVNMFGEGFDFPNLKIAALHDVHKSLGIVLQFTGRFTRTAGSNLGEATVIANSAVEQVEAAIERLYRDDSDWNELLSHFSATAGQDNAAAVQFFVNSERVDKQHANAQLSSLSPNQLRPKLGCVVYKLAQFVPENFIAALPENEDLPTWFNKDDRTLYFIKRTEADVSFVRLSSLSNTTWDLYVLYYHANSRLLFINSSDTDSTHLGLAKLVSNGTAEPLDSNAVFRCLTGINRLIYQSVGLKRHGSRNLSFSNFQGTDVGPALSDAQRALSTKSYMSGTGFQERDPISVGCSAKARIWTGGKKVTINQYIQWCNDLELKLSDTSINTDALLENVLIPDLVDELPPEEVLCLDWAKELWQKRLHAEIDFAFDSQMRSIDEFGITFESIDRSKRQIAFNIIHVGNSSTYVLELTQPGFKVSHRTGPRMTVKSGKFTGPMEEWLMQWPPNVVFMDGSELNGAELVVLKNRSSVAFPQSHLDGWDWTGTDIRKESMWKDKTLRADSIQYKVSALEEQSFDIVFDDDDAGEAADLVCIREETDRICLKLIHCKFTTSQSAGERIKDVVEVCAQAIRSSRWSWRFDKLSTHLMRRETSVLNGRTTRFRKGTARDLRTIASNRKNKRIETEIVIVQPGLSAANITVDQSVVLGSARSFLLDTILTELSVICSA